MANHNALAQRLFQIFDFATGNDQTEQRRTLVRAIAFRADGVATGAKALPNLRVRLPPAQAFALRLCSKNTQQARP